MPTETTVPGHARPGDLLIHIDPPSYAVVLDDPAPLVWVALPPPPAPDEPVIASADGR